MLAFCPRTDNRQRQLARGALWPEMEQSLNPRDPTPIRGRQEHAQVFEAITDVKSSIAEMRDEINALKRRVFRATKHGQTHHGPLKYRDGGLFWLHLNTALTKLTEHDWDKITVDLVLEAWP